MSDLEPLRAEWTALYSHTLPELARSRDPAQPKWPVTLDHCFARIILDNVIGNGERPWDEMLPRPAVRNMDESQLRDAIALGKDIIEGKTELSVLDQISLTSRGKNGTKYGKGTTGRTQKPMSTASPLTSPSSRPKRKATEEAEAEAGQPTKVSKKSKPNENKKEKEKKQSTLPFSAVNHAKVDGKEASSQPHPPPAGQTPSLPEHETSKPQLQAEEVDFPAILARITSHPSLTPYRRRLYTVLLSVPRGRYTTYAAMSTYLASSARAVGNGMRNNPFAPEVPCHRVLAADGTIGGFCGDWGEDGKHAKKKVELLRGEGVRFDGRGKVVGEPFRKFHEFHEFREGA